MNCRALFDDIVDKTCFVADLGIVGVPEAERLMAAATELRAKGELPDIVLFLAHPKTVALGLRDSGSDRPKDLLVSRRTLEEEGIALTRSVRGGGITYHWPGQVVCYPIVSLEGRERDIPAYMQRLEQVGIETLGRFGLSAARRRDSAAHLGLWLGGKKIVSMGVRVSNWITSFGFALNVDGDHSPSRYVRPCGLEGVKLTTMRESLGHAPPRQQITETVCERFAEAFCRKTQEMPESVFNRISAFAEPSNVIMTGSG